MSFTPQQQAINSACFAYFSRRREELQPHTRIAYYTTADTALRIIQNKTFWLRDPRLMNDFGEVVHGQKCLREVLRSPEVVAVAERATDDLFPGFFADLIRTWEEVTASGRAMPFVACLSEIHKDDDRGLLSMWRAYGGNNGVAMVLSDSLLSLDSNFVRTFHSPVLYGGSEDVKRLVLEIFGNLSTIADEVSAAGNEFLKERLMNALLFAMLSIKHVGFAEEREWRMIHHLSDESAHIKYRSEVVRGNAEVVCEVNLASHSALAPGAMFEKVIVGPCAFPESAGQALSLAFEKAGGGIPAIVRSDIPLRHI
jgi:hypothetical protein